MVIDFPPRTVGVSEMKLVLMMKTMLIWKQPVGHSDRLCLSFIGIKVRAAESEGYK